LNGHGPTRLGRFDRSELEINDMKKEIMGKALIRFCKMLSNHIPSLFNISGWGALPNRPMANDKL
jgi:hypothetical protein